MLEAPYLIVGFSVADGTPLATAIIAELEAEIPVFSPPPFSLGVPDVYALMVTTANMNKKLTDVAKFFIAKNQVHGGVIRWFAQLCESAKIALE